MHLYNPQAQALRGRCPKWLWRILRWLTARLWQWELTCAAQYPALAQGVRTQAGAVRQLSAELEETRRSNALLKLQLEAERATLRQLQKKARRC